MNINLFANCDKKLIKSICECARLHSSPAKEQEKIGKTQERLA